MTPRRGQMVGRMGVKSRFNSDLHQIWWEGAFLQVIEGSLIIFMTSLLWATHLTSKGFKLVLLGPNLSKLDHTCSNWFKVEQTYLDLHKLVSNLHKRCIFIYYEPPLTQIRWTMTSDWPRGCEAELFVVREDPFVAFLSFDQIWLKFAPNVYFSIS